MAITKSYDPLGDRSFSDGRPGEGSFGRFKTNNCVFLHHRLDHSVRYFLHIHLATIKTKKGEGVKCTEERTVGGHTNTQVPNKLFVLW